MTTRACPFCGIETELPHESQESCIEALQTEIARVRGVLETSRPLDAPAPPAPGPEPPNREGGR